MCDSIIMKSGDIMIDSSGKPIRGNIEPFRSDLDSVSYNAITNNGFSIFREHMKDAVALRMLCTVLKPVPISQNCINDITNYFGQNNFSAFVGCSLRYYCGIKKHIAKIDKTCSCCTARDKQKSVQHAKKDCIRCVSFYTNRIKTRVNKISDASISNLDEKCKIVNLSAKFVAEYISALLVETLPKRLPVEVYNYVLTVNNSIKNYYCYNSYNNLYILQNKNATYRSLTLEFSTAIFCAYFKFNNNVNI